jgi:hypothetical protein
MFPSDGSPMVLARPPIPTGHPAPGLAFPLPAVKLGNKVPP